MPEYLAPGVYVEETSFRAKSIEGVSTSTTGFTGLTRKGPLDGTPELITSFGDFERIYGGFADLELGGTRVPNYLAHAVRAYFDNGGARLYVARVYAPAAPGQGTAASAWTGDGPAESNKIRFVARHPGGAGNGRAIARLVESPATVRGMKGAPEGTLLRIDVLAAGPALSGPARVLLRVQDAGEWVFTWSGDRSFSHRETVSLALLRQSSASERLRGVSWTERIENPGADVPIEQLLRGGEMTENTRGIRLGGFVEIRTIIQEELERAFQGQQNAQQAAALAGSSAAADRSRQPAS